MATTEVANLHRRLRALQSNGGWGFQPEQQTIEQTCLAIMALRHDRAGDLESILDTLEILQNADGSWPAFIPDESEGCWTTALVVLSLIATGRKTERLQRAIGWLLAAKGREANWFWRWKFQTVDDNVKFDPAKYGWNWVPGTTSWVIPTAFSVIALRQISSHRLKRTADVSERIGMGISMLLDRMCPGGGWNAGNGMAFGVAYTPYIDATAIALLALGGYEKEPGVRASLIWLVNRVSGCPSPYSLAWGILALAAYRNISSEANETLGRTAKELATRIEDETRPTYDVCTLATCALALEAVEGDSVFEVRG